MMAFFKVEFVAHVIIDAGFAWLVRKNRAFLFLAKWWEGTGKGIRCEFILKLICTVQLPSVIIFFSFSPTCPEVNSFNSLPVSYCKSSLGPSAVTPNSNRTT